ncbi:hypothetical protein CHARACLAT_033337 [Characodon lateralis]|uniref:Uncharacterized protein n=1 Tax=Characodon lateralis TaxID=208331 RepID=A0ABU7DP64_9TELE|nr:hypothetical protein [Characodon lateralis]
MALHVLTRGSLTAIRYRDEILRPLVRPSLSFVSVVHPTMRTEFAVDMVFVSQFYGDEDEDGPVVEDLVKQCDEARLFEHRKNYNHNSNLFQEVFSPSIQD